MELSDLSWDELKDMVLDLQKENAELRACSKKVDMRNRPVLPYAVAEKYEGQKLSRGYACTRLRFMTHSDVDALSNLIRGMCFRNEQKIQKRPGGFGSVNTTVRRKIADFTDDENQKYAEIFSEVTDLLSKYAIDTDKRISEGGEENG